MLTKLTIDSFKGIINTKTKFEIPQNFFISATNIDINNSGKIVSRKGAEKIIDGSFIKLFSTGEYLYAISEDKIIAYDKNYTPYTLLNIEDTEVDFIFFNGFSIFSYKNSLYVFDRITPIDVVKIDFVERITKLSAYLSSIIVATENIIYFSEPFSFRVSGKYSFAFDGKVKSISPVEEGLFVGTEYSTFFLKGRNITSFNLIKVLNEPILEGSEAFVTKKDLNPELQQNIYSSGRGIIFSTPKGIYLGFDDRNLINLTNDLYRPNIEKGKGNAILIDSFDLKNYILIFMEEK